MPSAVSAMISLFADMRPRTQQHADEHGHRNRKCKYAGENAQKKFQDWLPEPLCRTNNDISRTSWGTKKTT